MVEMMALCVEGLESFLIEDLKEKGATNINSDTGMVFFEMDELSKLKAIRSAEDIMILAVYAEGIGRYRYSLKKIRREAANTDFRQILKILAKFREIKPSFKVRASYIGRRDYKAAEIEDAVLEGIPEDWQKSEQPEILINAILRQDELFIGISLEKVPYHIRDRLNKTLPGSLRPSIAYCMIKAAGLNKEAVVVDPMCGSGTIVIEAVSQGTKAIGGDINKEKVKVAEENASLKKIDAEFKVWDARKTGLPDNTADAIICNLPFEKQVGFEDEPKQFFKEFIEEMLRISKPKSVFVFLTRHSPILEEIVQEKNLALKKIPVMRSGLNSEMLILKR